MNREQKLQKLAKLTGLDLEYAYGTEPVLDNHDKHFHHVNVPLMGEDTYQEWQDSLNHNEVKGEGFTVYAWCDASGFEYWCNEGMNYQQVTVKIHDVDKCLKQYESILTSLEQYMELADKFSSYYVENLGVPTEEDIEEALKDIKK